MPPDDLVSLFPRPTAPPGIRVVQGVVEAWDESTGNNTITVAGGQLVNVPSLTGESASLAAGDVVMCLAAAGKWFVLGKVTTPGDPGTVPTWNADITALSGQVDTIQNVTIPAVQNDVTIVQGDVVTAQTTADNAATTASGAASDAATAVTAANAAQASADALQGRFPITSTDITDDAITTPKIAANAITAAELAADAVTGKTVTGGLFRTAVSGKRLEIDSVDDTGQLTFFSGFASEVTPANIQVATNAFSGYLNIAAPATTAVPDPPALLLAAANDSSLSQVNLTCPNNILISSANNGITLEGTQLYFNGYAASVGGPHWLGYLSTAPSVPAANTPTTLAGWTALESDGITLSAGGTFTVPEAGLYRISGQVWWAPSNSAVQGTRLTQAVKTSGSTQVIASVTVDPPSGTSTSKAPALAQWNKLYRLAAGDTVIVRFQHGSTTGTETNKVPTASTQDISFFQIVRERL